MSEYRTTATLTAEGTFVVPAPKDLPAGTRAEVTVRLEGAPAPKKSLEEFYRWLETQPPRPTTAEAEKALVRPLRDEWD